MKVNNRRRGEWGIMPKNYTIMLFSKKMIKIHKNSLHELKKSKYFQRQLSKLND